MQASSTQSNNKPANVEAEADQARLFQCSTCKRSFTRADHLTRHVRAQPANKRQKREIARDTRVVQACEACSQSHLRCEDEKPCSRCKKKKIPCRVPEALAPDENENENENEVHEIDAVHAAQDLLDLSHGFDYPPSLPPHSGSANPSMSTTSQTPEPFSNSQHQLLPDSNITNHQSAGPGDSETHAPILSDMQPLSNSGNGLISMNHNFEDKNHTSSMAFFDSSLAPFDTTPGQNPFLPDYFRNMPPFESFMSGQATPRGIMDLSFDIDVGLTDLDLGLLDQYNFQVPFAADTPSTDTQGIDPRHSETDTTPVRAEAFKQSIWRYLPQSSRNPSAEQVNLAFSDTERDNSRRAHIAHRRVIAEKMGQSRSFEEDNTAIRDLQHLQTFLLQLGVGMWSGISRKMEIAESFLQPLITMLRRGSRYRRWTWKEISPEPDEQGAALESKWQSWVGQESFLRLIYRTFEFDRHSSLALLKPPLISYAEMQLPLPSANALWQAKTAASWKAAYLNMAAKTAKRPSAMECFLNLEHLSQHDHASLTYLHMIWGTIWDYRQMCTVTLRSKSTSNNSLILSSRYQELTKQLEDFRLSCPPMTKSVEITLEIMLVHLNAPLDDIQLFAGIEGQEEARSAYLGLREWTKTPAARQALWHAGQILRAAEVLPKALLSNFNAIAVYHAGLILWCYGFLKRSAAPESTQVDTSVILNGDDSLSARKFITLDRGIPSIKIRGSHNPTQLNDQQKSFIVVLVFDPAHFSTAHLRAFAVAMTSLKTALSLSKEEVRNARPPGTATLVGKRHWQIISVHFTLADGLPIEHLEWAASQTQKEEIRLVPQPSADPADPLNLSMWRKLVMLAVMSIHPFVVNFTSSSISSALPIYASTGVFGFPPKTFSQLTYFIAVNILMLGVSNLWWVPLANTLGRRPVVLGSLLLLTFSSMWAGLATSFDSMLAARLFMGIGGGPADAVSPEVVGEIFFVHQRGRALAIYTVFLALGSLVGAVAGGYIVTSMSLSWLHWMNVLLSAITFVLCLVFQAETLYNRPVTTVTFDDDDPNKQTVETKERITVSDSAAASSYPSYSYLRSLRLITYQPGICSKSIAPFKVLRLPGVWLVSLWYAGLVGLIVTMSTVGPQIVGAPPYLWGNGVGLINIGGIIGALFGCVYTYLVADFTTKRMAKKDLHGFSEPESRLVTALPALFFATGGALIFGFVAQNPSPTGWVGLQFGFGLVSFGLMQAPSVGFNYLIEAYGALAGDCFVAVTTVRGIVSFAWTFFVGEWVTHQGAAEPFGIFGMLMGLFGLLTVPMLIWGKRLRIWTAKWVSEDKTA
ncbi:MFS general substrate transporter [Stemphylium lycopersici]|nr:MFS general substrate transporter [Stemphylium lycopersici]